MATTCIRSGGQRLCRRTNPQQLKNFDIIKIKIYLHSRFSTVIACSHFFAWRKGENSVDNKITVSDAAQSVACEIFYLGGGGYTLNNNSNQAYVLLSISSDWQISRGNQDDCLRCLPIGGVNPDVTQVGTGYPSQIGEKGVLLDHMYISPQNSESKEGTSTRGVFHQNHPRRSTIIRRAPQNTNG
ncbi:hypothetical protein Tsp_14163 [Trichinella spiralis]|uniref:hypothetical protein n=1 Tax=Trichinella spiralis TaxID=6334 RepID=UPI0001EFE45D|nr:hypothetical protein Tsp_14163 [Trichinella spiralis]